MQLRRILYLFLGLTLSSCQLTIESPSHLRAFSSPATSEEVIRFSQRASSKSDWLSLETFGRSETGIPLVAIKAANPGNKNPNPLKVMIFAQQHGNEQSGKEAALLLISDLAKDINTHWLDNMEIWIIPQMNPDGSDVNERRNAGGLDLNRDHIALLAPETRALHNLFFREMPHVTVDIHEYQPFTESWENFGAFKTFDVQVGIPTNLNVDPLIRNFAYADILPTLENHLISKGFSFQNYIVGPVPTEGRTRHSTVDLDDGRHSFAILNTLSLIYEGINGRDGFTENLERRTYGQYEAIMALLNFLHENHEQTLQMVENGRNNLMNAIPGEMVAIRMEHHPDGNPLRLTLSSSKTGLDTLVVVENYHPVVKTSLEVSRPKAYLIPSGDSLLLQFLQLHQVQILESFELSSDIVKSWTISKINKSEDEELTNRFPEVVMEVVSPESLQQNYVYVSTAQLHSNFLVQMLEPQSMLGLAQRPGYEYLLKEGERFPVLRVETIP
jgi:hypothetical protein